MNRRSRQSSSAASCVVVALGLVALDIVQTNASYAAWQLSAEIRSTGHHSDLQSSVASTGNEAISAVNSAAVASQKQDFSAFRERGDAVSAILHRTLSDCVDDPSLGSYQRSARDAAADLENLRSAGSGEPALAQQVGAIGELAQSTLDAAVDGHSAVNAEQQTEATDAADGCCCGAHRDFKAAIDPFVENDANGDGRPVRELQRSE